MTSPAPSRKRILDTVMSGNSGLSKAMTSPMLIVRSTPDPPDPLSSGGLPLRSLSPPDPRPPGGYRSAP